MSDQLCGNGMWRAGDFNGGSDADGVIDPKEGDDSYCVIDSRQGSDATLVIDKICGDGERCVSVTPSGSD